MQISWSTLLSLLIGVAGWFYLFYSRAAHGLRPIEAAPSNVRRIRLRRVNGAAMILLAVLLYIGAVAVDARQRPRVFLAVWIGVICLLLLVVILALIDVRLTMRLRTKEREDRN